MPVLYIDKADHGAARALSDDNFDFNEVNFTEPTNEITLVAHTDSSRETIGGMLPAEVASTFSKKIKHKLELSHVYLISCEAGLIRRGQPSLAQKLADQMNRKGFANVVVHAITNPVGGLIEGMRVEVVTKPSTLRPHEPTGSLRAFYYSDEKSALQDTEILNLSQEIEHLEGQRLNRDGKLRLKQLRQQCLTLTRAANKGKIDILSAADYKAAMNEDVNTFTADGPKLVMSAAVSAALFYLESQKRSAKEKHQDYLNEDINTLKTNPSWDASKIQEELTKIHRPKTAVMGFGSSSYFGVIIQGLYQRLTDINNVIGLTTAAIEEKPSTPVVVHNSAPGSIPSYAATNPNTLFQPQTNAQKISIDELRKDLIDYKAKREGEWSYHYNFLGIEALIYFISDCILGTDYFNARSRSVKIEATSKLVDHLDQKNHGPFTTHEKNALGEGRLGKIISTYATDLDCLLAATDEPRSAFVAS